MFSEMKSSSHTGFGNIPWLGSLLKLPTDGKSVLSGSNPMTKSRVCRLGDPFQLHFNYTMNGLTQKAFQAGEKCGKAEVDMNGTACKAPSVGPYLQKKIDGDCVGKKRKQARC